MREEAARVENAGVSPMDRQLRINWDGVKLIQICYEIHIIHLYNIGVVYCIMLIFTSFNLTYVDLFIF